ncbi:hypothetical protein Tco_0432967 [Tanacetum coccineum]
MVMGRFMDGVMDEGIMRGRDGKDYGGVGRCGGRGNQNAIRMSSGLCIEDPNMMAKLFVTIELKKGMEERGGVRKEKETIDL